MAPEAPPDQNAPHMQPLRQTPAWAALEDHAAAIRNAHLRDLFAADPARGERMTVEAVGLYLDYSKHRVTDETIGLLLRLADERGLALADRRDVLGRAHQRDRGRARCCTWRSGRPARSRSSSTARTSSRASTRCSTAWSAFADRVRSGEWTGHTGRPIRNVVNIGIGGSDLGPVMAYEALRHYTRRDLTFRFVSNVDGTDFAEATRDLDPAETLFIVSSKTFTTLETMTKRAHRP